MDTEQIERIATALERIATELSDIKTIKLCDHRCMGDCEPGTRRYTKQVDEVLKVMPTIRKECR